MAILPQLLVDFATATQNPTYQWEQRSRRYRDRTSGKFLSKSAIAQLTQLRIAQVTQDLHSLGNLLLDGKITLRAWQEQFAVSLKILHTQQYLLGTGGQSHVQNEDYLVLARELKSQYKYLRNFAVDLTRGVMSPAQFKVRAAMYAKAVKVSYFRGEKQAAVRSGLDGAYRVLGEAEHCVECLEYHAQGMVPIDRVILPQTFCSCMVNCKCSLLFGKLADAIKPKPVSNGDTSLLKQVQLQAQELTSRQIRELVDDYKLDTSGNADVLKQRFTTFITAKNDVQLGNINDYIQQVKTRIPS